MSVLFVNENLIGMMMHHKPLPSFTIFDDYRPTVAIAVTIRWLLLGAWFFLNNYRVEEDPFHLVLNLLGAGLAALNGYLTWRIVTNRPITWLHALTLSITDLTVITVGLFITSGLANDFFVFYYPALLGFSLMFPRRASFAVALIIVALYTTMSLTVEPTLDWEQEDEKKLAVRLISMLGIVAAGTLITTWERARRREAVASERRRATENLELQRKAQEAELAAVEERSRIAREIHDGIAQSIYMLNISLEACADLASREQNGNERNLLHQRLNALVRISKQALLDTRHYIFDLKPVLDGSRSITEMVNNQVQEFRTVTSIPTDFSVYGTERPLSLAASAGLYRITQEGLANVFKHSQATQVKVRLSFTGSEVQLDIEDNGQGFAPEAKRARADSYGLSNMQARARELGGSLEIISSPGQGARLALRLPATANRDKLLSSHL